MSMPTASPRQALVIAAFLLPAGCATHIKYLCHNIAPSSTFVTVESTPPGAIAKFSDGRTTTTPCRVCLRSDQDIAVELSKDGYLPTRVDIGPGFNAWYLGNLLAFPPFGFLIDAEQEAITRSSPGSVHVELERLARAPRTTESPGTAP